MYCQPCKAYRSHIVQLSPWSKLDPSALPETALDLNYLCPIPLLPSPKDLQPGFLFPWPCVSRTAVGEGEGLSRSCLCPWSWSQDVNSVHVSQHRE